jgi:hypothetical protein
MSMSIQERQALFHGHLPPSKEPIHFPFRTIQGLWDCISYPFRKLCSNIVAPLAFPSYPLTNTPEIKNRIEIERVLLKATRQGEEIDLITPDDVKINGMHFRGQIKKALIFIHGNGGYYETAAPIPLDLRSSIGDIHVLTINPRGTGKSEGVPHPHTLPYDTLTAFQYLVEKEGMDPNDIVIMGHSMGGAHGAEAARLVQESYPDKKINFISDRSFGDLVAECHMIIDKVFENSCLRACTSFIKYVIDQLVRCCEWQMLPHQALETLKGRVCILYHKDDPTIPYPASLYKKTKSSSRCRDYTCIKLKDDHWLRTQYSDGLNPHNRPYTSNEKFLICNEIRKMLQLPFAHLHHKQVKSLSPHLVEQVS